MDGLGISFEGSLRGHGHVQYAHDHHGHLVQAPHLRRLGHSVSLDQGLNLRFHQQPMVRQPSEGSEGSTGKRVRIAAGSPEELAAKNGQHYHHSRLSPLSDFDTSSASDTGSSQPFSPASLSDLPSSTESGAYPTFYAHPPPPSLRPGVPHEPSAPGMVAAQSRPYPPLDPTVQHFHPQQQQQPSSRPSRLPAFLQDRQHGLARPQSMMELAQAYSRPLGVVRGPRAAEEASESNDHRVEHVEYAAQQYDASPEPEPASARLYGLESPGESVPSSAGGLQRRHLERQLQEQKELLEKERRRLRQSEGRPRERPLPKGVEPLRPLQHQRSRSLSAQEMRQLAEAEMARAPVQRLRRSQSHGYLQEEGREEDLTYDDDEPEKGGEEADSGTVISLDQNCPVPTGPADLVRQNTLLTAGASTVRRRMELNRLLAPTGKGTSHVLPSITDSPTPSSTSSAVTASTRNRAASRASTTLPATIPSPVCLEQAKSTSRARVELDLVLETPLVVEGGLLKGKLELRVRKPKDKEGEVWISKPKVRVIGFEELGSNDSRYIFFHHAESLSSVPTPNNAAPLTLPCFDTQPDSEGYCRAKLGQHVVPVRMSLPVGKGAKGPWKGKQGVVRYIAIASVKLKSKSGTNRSIAHFYRHVDVFPYFNPALVLAPAVKPLRAEAAKSLFMGGSGKVSLKTSMHRETWVAGQRCYVDVRVENESGKKIKTLTLALVRTTTIYRPSATEGGPSHTQSTRKKVAETTLEMGKKGTKGVTAKGSWMGVDAGESADFSHSLLVPSDALSIPRGRHVEVSYAVKISVGGSLSADVAADIPIRIIDFVSLDPPPGHVGASPVVKQQQQAVPLARSWSSNQLRSQASNQHLRTMREGPLMNRMVSIDSLRLEDLNGGRGPSRLGTYQPQPALSRISSLNSIRTNDLPRAEPVAEYDVVSMHQALAEEQVHPDLARTEALVDRALSRQLHHQMSLDCISSAIASATARRQQGVERTPSSLRSAASSADIRRWEDEQHGAVEQQQEEFYSGGGESQCGENVYGAEGMGIQLDELDEVPDDPAFLDGGSLPGAMPDPPVEQDDESDEELEAIMQSHFSDDEEGAIEEDDPSARSFPLPPSPRRSEHPAAPPSPVKVVNRPRSSSLGKPSSPVKPIRTHDSLRARSPTKRSPDRFGFATPSSPVKAVVEQPSDDEFRKPVARTVRPLPTPPSASGPRSVSLTKQPSGSSLCRTPGIVRKAPSTRSLRSVASSVELSTRPPVSAHVPLPPSRSPSLASPKVSPVVATVRTRSTMSPTTVAPSSPRRVVKTPSPALRATRSMADLSSSPQPSSSASRRTSVLPSVKTKVAALETRQATLTRLATTSGRARVSSTQLARADSVASNASLASEASFKLSDLTRANSTASFMSFKAPMLKRTFADAPPVPVLPSLSHE
ncbi:hypothetical protein JCM8547_007774 [Rhodosporidiobolus lusitaniae]